MGWKSIKRKVRKAVKNPKLSAGLGAGSMLLPGGHIVGAALLANSAYQGFKQKNKGGDKPNTTQVSGWDPQQQRLAKELIDSYLPDIESFAPTRQSGRDSLAGLLSGRPNYEEVDNFYQNSVLNPARYELDNTIIPGIRNKARNYFGTSVAHAEDAARERFGMEMSKRLSDLRLRELDKAREGQQYALGLLPKYDPRGEVLQMLGVTPVDTIVQPQQQGLFDPLMPWNWFS